MFNSLNNRFNRRRDPEVEQLRTVKEIARKGVNADSVTAARNVLFNIRNIYPLTAMEHEAAVYELKYYDINNERVIVFQIHEQTNEPYHRIEEFSRSKHSILYESPFLVRILGSDETIISERPLEIDDGTSSEA